MVFDKLKSVFFKSSDEDDFDLDYEEFEEVEEKKVKKRVVEKEPVVVKQVQKPIVFEPENETVMSDITVDQFVREKEVEKRVIRSDRHKEFEIPQVISPIRGLKEEEVEKSSNYVPKVTKKHKNTFGAVISPFFGEDIETIVETPKAEEMKQEYVEEDIENISLDDIVEQDELASDAIIQYSLFGGATRIKEEDKEEQTEEELPF